MENKEYRIRKIESGDRPCGIVDKSLFCRFNPKKKPFGCFRTWCKCDEELFLHRCKECRHSDNQDWCTLRKCIFEYITEIYNEIIDKKIETYEFIAFNEENDIFFKILEKNKHLIRNKISEIKEKIIEKIEKPNELSDLLVKWLKEIIGGKLT